MEKWDDRKWRGSGKVGGKKKSFPPYIRLREWKSLEMKNSFVLLSRSGRMENVVCINLLSCP